MERMELKSKKSWIGKFLPLASSPVYSVVINDDGITFRTEEEIFMPWPSLSVTWEPTRRCLGKTADTGSYTVVFRTAEHQFEPEWVLSQEHLHTLIRITHEQIPDHIDFTNMPLIHDPYAKINSMLEAAALQERLGAKRAASYLYQQAVEEAKKEYGGVMDPKNWTVKSWFGV